MGKVATENTLLSVLENVGSVADVLANGLREQNTILKAMARDEIKNITHDWSGLAELGSELEELFDYGDQFIDTWRDVQANKDYTYPYQLNHFADVELEDGEILTRRPFLQAHFAHPFSVQFSHQRAFLACPDGLSVGTYYFTIKSAWGTNVQAGDVVCFTLTQPVPEGGKISGCYGAPDQAKSTWRIYTHSADGKTVIETITPTFSASGTNLGTMEANKRVGNLNSCQEMAYGWNRWKTSALRQYLNSELGVGQWWTAQDEFDIAPNELTTKAGFLSGCSEDFINSLKKVKVTTYINTVNDGGEADITYDRVFLPSLEEIFVVPQKSGEGEYHEYWKRRSGSRTPLAQYGTYPNMITYAVENRSSAQYVTLRSCYRSFACYRWVVNSSGIVSSYYASYAHRFAPLVVI